MARPTSRLRRLRRRDLTAHDLRHLHRIAQKAEGACAFSGGLSSGRLLSHVKPSALTPNPTHFCRGPRSVAPGCAAACALRTRAVQNTLGISSSALASAHRVHSRALSRHSPMLGTRRTNNAHAHVSEPAIQFLMVGELQVLPASKGRRCGFHQRACTQSRRVQPAMHRKLQDANGELGSNFRRSPMRRK